MVCQEQLGTKLNSLIDGVANGVDCDEDCFNWMAPAPDNETYSVPGFRTKLRPE